MLVVDDVRVRGAAAQTPDARIVQRGIAVHRKQPATGAILREPALVAHEPALVVHAAVLDPEHADMAFAIERNVARVERILRIRTNAIERAVQVARNLPSTSQWRTSASSLYEVVGRRIDSGIASGGGGAPLRAMLCR
jgi:hypothetical protein